MQMRGCKIHLALYLSDLYPLLIARHTLIVLHILTERRSSESKKYVISSNCSIITPRIQFPVPDLTLDRASIICFGISILAEINQIIVNSRMNFTVKNRNPAFKKFSDTAK